MAFIVSLFLSPRSSHCQTQVIKESDPQQQQDEPKTKLETFKSKYETLLLKGYIEVGKQNLNPTIITVYAQELFDVKTKDRVTGINILIDQRSEHGTSYVDYDDIESLINGIDYISKVDGTITKFPRFEVYYRTRGHLEIGAFNRETVNPDDKKILYEISCGTIGGARARCDITGLMDFKALIIQAKERLDTIK